MSKSAIRLLVYLRAEYKCEYCGLVFPIEWRDQLTVDHIIPHCKGGRFRLVNLAACCKQCNVKKADHVSGRVQYLYDKMVAQDTEGHNTDEIRRDVLKAVHAFLERKKKGKLA